jgi:two-component system, response regulator PdtaR
MYRIAIADDDQVDRALLKYALSCVGHEVIIEVRSGEDLIRQCEAAQPDLVITDIQMTGIDGLEAAERILELFEIPAIVISGHTDESFIERASDSGALAYLIKPVGQEDLAAAVSIAMQRFQDVQALRAEVDNMREALEDRKIIERAKGIIMSKRQLDEPAAFRFLQQLARSHRTKLVEVAKSILLADSALEPRCNVARS